MVQISRLISFKSCINNIILVNTEHIAISKALILVDFLPFVSYNISNNLSNIFYDDF